MALRAARRSVAGVGGARVSDPGSSDKGPEPGPRGRYASARTVHTPRTVSAIDPTRWLARCRNAHPKRPDISSAADSPEKAENVVSPPRKPVTTKRRSAGARCPCASKERDRDADEKPADQVGGEGPERQLGHKGVQSHAERPAQPGAEGGPDADRSGARGVHAASFVPATQRAAASSSEARASTQRAPAGVCSFFQNGARVFR